MKNMQPLYNESAKNIEEQAVQEKTTKENSNVLAMSKMKMPQTFNIAYKENSIRLLKKFQPIEETAGMEEEA